MEMRENAEKASPKLEFQAMGQNTVLQRGFYEFHQVIHVNANNDGKSGYCEPLEESMSLIPAPRPLKAQLEMNHEEIVI